MRRFAIVRTVFIYRRKNIFFKLLLNSQNIIPKKDISGGSSLSLLKIDIKAEMSKRKERRKKEEKRGDNNKDFKSDFI